MRRLLPLWSSLFAVLLLTQWAGAAAACLPRAAGHGAPLCIVAVADDHSAPAPPDHAMVAGCPLCAPLAPAILPGPAGLAPTPAIHPAVVIADTPAWTAPHSPLPSPLQARAPPVKA
jgi:hypothetical protein